MSDVNALLREIGQKAKHAAARLVTLSPEIKNRALLAMAESLVARSSQIKEANLKDLEAGQAKGLSGAMLDRLMLDDKRIASMAKALQQVALLEDPVGEIYDMHVRPNGLRVGRMRMPIGVIGIIYESRPNVTVDAGALCLKSGNAVVLRGGSEAFATNQALAEIMDAAAQTAGLPEHCVQLVPTTDRAAVQAMLTLNAYIDLIIPRGGRSLIELVVKTSTIPVIKHYDGNCHIFVDESAEFEMAERIIINAKCQRPGVCNAMESLLVHEKIAPQFLPRVCKMLQERGVEIRGDQATCKLVPGAKAASEDDFRAEFLDLILSVAVVPSLDAAIEWINTYGSHHTDAILTSDHRHAMRFLSEVDSACVFVNCSTRFSDGGEFGMGCEIGISTDKLHARGPMGLRELTTSKFIVFGDGQVRS
ncbi:MAG: glutamate-5-semialdehyde dehydrogenase [Candidatus Sumerlaeaceae bacterium]|nr:glutamate-5-semialdehyde dehydrogenase [Candidatus Sumerlaeaceae bacterium]